MNVGTRSRCKHVYLHVDRKFQVRGHGKGMVPIWQCSLKRKDLAGVCKGLAEAGIEETSCHPDECPLAVHHEPWEKCPFYTPLF